MALKDAPDWRKWEGIKPIVIEEGTTYHYDEDEVSCSSGASATLLSFTLNAGAHVRFSWLRVWTEIGDENHQLYISESPGGNIASFRFRECIQQTLTGLVRQNTGSTAVTVGLVVYNRSGKTEVFHVSWAYDLIED